MPKLRPEDVADLDVEALDAIEYSTEEFDTYNGEIPPVGTELTGYVKKMWWTRTAPKAGGGGDDPMLKILWVASDNEGEVEEYNDCPFWLNAALIGSAKFRWAPFLDCYGLSLRDIKTKLYVSKKEDQNGAPIERIGAWKPGEDSDAAWCRIIADQEPYNGTMSARVKEWLMWDEEGATEPDGEGEEAGAEDGEEEGVEIFEDADGNLVDDEGNFYDEEGNLIEEEPEPEPEPARARRAAKPAAKVPARAPARSAPARAASPAPATTRTRTAAPARTAPARSAPAGRAATTKPARGRGRAAAAQEEPPF